MITKCRAKEYKVSQNFIRVAVRKLIKTAQPDEVESFEASVGWFMRFIKRKCIKFCKRKVGRNTMVN